MKRSLNKLKQLISITMALSIIGCIVQPVKANTNRLLPIYSVFTDQKKVAITFDCAWEAKDIESILKTLKDNQVKATFFLVGDWIRKYPEETKMIVAEGHDIANHSNKHPHVAQMAKEEIKKDIRLAHNTIKEVTGVDAKLYRPPYGEYNNTVIEAADECNYYTIQWDVDSLDWKEYGRQQLIDRVLKHKNLSPGSIILLHNSTKYTQSALDELIKGLKQKGYTMVPVSELIFEENYTIDHTGRQYPKS